MDSDVVAIKKLSVYKWVVLSSVSCLLLLVAGVGYTGHYSGWWWGDGGGRGAGGGAGGGAGERKPGGGRGAGGGAGERKPGGEGRDLPAKDKQLEELLREDDLIPEEMQTLEQKYTQEIHTYDVWCGILDSCHGITSTGIPEQEPDTSRPKEAMMHFVVLGDWGSNPIYRTTSRNQRKVADAVTAWCHKVKCDFILSTGDNIYKDGVTSPRDVRFNTTWRDVYIGPSVRNLTWYMSLGNHDYGQRGSKRELHQVAFSRTESRWYQPHLYYSFRKRKSNISMEFLMLDTNALKTGRWQPEKQITWLEETLNKSDADWLFAAGHHPAYTAGGHAPGTSQIRDDVIPLLEKYHADAVLFGHDHNLQHIYKRHSSRMPRMDHVISGGGGGTVLYPRSNRYFRALTRAGYELKFFNETLGFVGVKVTKKNVKFDYITADGNLIYHFVKLNNKKRRDEGKNKDDPSKT